MPPIEGFDPFQHTGVSQQTWEDFISRDPQTAYRHWSAMSRNNVFLLQHINYLQNLGQELERNRTEEADAYDRQLQAATNQYKELKDNYNTMNELTGQLERNNQTLTDALGRVGHTPSDNASFVVATPTYSDTTTAMRARIPDVFVPPAGWRPNQRSSKANDPEPFDGSKREDLRGFLAEALGKLSANFDHFLTEGSRVHWLLTLLRGTAREQVIHGVTDTQNPWTHVGDMLERLQEAFDVVDLEETAQHKVSTLRQANRPFAEYFAEFMRFAPASNYPEDVPISMLRRNISSELINATMFLNPSTMDMYHYSKELLRVDNALRPAPGQGSKSKGKTPATAPPAPRYTSAPPTGDPMDLSTKTTRSLTPQERERRRAGGLCFYCGKGEHIASECPSAPRGMRAKRTNASASTTQETPAAQAPPAPPAPKDSGNA